MGRYKQPYSIFKRGKYWYYRTYTIDGQRTIPKTTGQTNKNLAREYCDRLYLRGELNQTDKTFKEYAEHFYDDNGLYFRDRAKALSSNTKRGYQSYFKKNILPYWANYKLADITYTELKKFRSELLERLEVNTVGKVMVTLKIIITTAYRDRLITLDPFTLLEPLKWDREKIDAYDLNEVIGLYNYNDKQEYKNLIIIMALCGLRVSEALAITSDNIKVTENGVKYLDIKKQFNRGKLSVPKTQSSIRAVPIIDELIKHINNEPEDYQQFVNSYVDYKVKGEDEGRKVSTFHSIRHFFITNAKSKGINKDKVEVIAGHTLHGQEATYTNFTPDDLAEITSWQKETYRLITG